MTIWLAAFASSLHVLGIIAGAGSLFMRGRYLRATLDEDGLKRLFAADNVSGLAAIAIVGSGLWRLFALEKSTDFFVYNGMFWVKMGLLTAALAVETFPMITFIRWRMALQRGETLDLRRVPLLTRLNDLETVIVLLIIVVAPMMARAVWLLG